MGMLTLLVLFVVCIFLWKYIMPFLVKSLVTLGNLARSQSVANIVAPTSFTGQVVRTMASTQPAATIVLDSFHAWLQHHNSNSPVSVSSISWAMTPSHRSFDVFAPMAFPEPSIPQGIHEPNGRKRQDPQDVILTETYGLTEEKLHIMQDDLQWKAALVKELATEPKCPLSLEDIVNKTGEQKGKIRPDVSVIFETISTSEPNSNSSCHAFLFTNTMLQEWFQQQSKDHKPPSNPLNRKRVENGNYLVLTPK